MSVIPLKQRDGLIDLTEDETIAAIKKCLREPPLNSRVFTITPKVARWVDEHCRPATQRRKSPKSINRFAKAMRAGEWYLTGQPIIFTKGELLADGQNRIDACLISGKPFEVHVMFGIPDKYFAHIDTGNSRTPANALQIGGFIYDQHCSSAIRWIKMFETGRVKLRETFENHEVLAWGDAHKPALVDNPNSVVRVAVRVDHEPVGTLAALLWVFRKADPEHAAEFEKALLGDPTANRLALNTVGGVRQKLSEMGHVAQGRIKEVPRLAHYVTAWNYILAGSKKGGAKANYLWDGGTKLDPVAFPIVAKNTEVAKQEIAKLTNPVSKLKPKRKPARKPARKAA